MMRKLCCFCPGRVLMSAICRGVYPRCAGRVGYSAGGLGSYGASAWGSAEMEPGGTTHSGARGLEVEGLEVEATGGMDGLDVEERGAPAPPLSLLRRDMQEAAVITPLRREVDGHGGLRAPGSRLPPRGTRVAPQIFTEARDKDVGSDRRNVPWSPKNILIDTVARLQRGGYQG